MTHVIRLVEPSRAVLLLVILLVASNVHQTASCTDDQFQCNSSRCISKHLTCDGENDCGDFSDEINCTFRGKCNSDEFVCSEGSCISSTLVCDGKWDCPRGLDETNCASKTTAPTTPPFDQLGLFQTADGKIKSFPVYEKSQGISIYLRFTAHKCAGHLFEMTSQNTDQFFLLSLTGNGNLEFLFKTSSGPGMVVIPPSPGDSFCNGKRHMLSVRRYLDELRFRVNRKRSITKKIGLLRESFSRPFRVYVGMTLEGCVSGIDVIFYLTRSKTYSVGYSRGCAKPKKTTPILPRETTASTLSLESPTLRTRLRKESVIHKSNTPFPTSEVSKQGTFTLGTTVTQRKEVTHSLPVTHPASISGSFTRGYISQGAQTPRMSRHSEATRASTSMPTTQSEDVMDPYFVDQGTITSTYSKSPLVTKHTTSSTSLSPTVTPHSLSPTVESVTTTTRKRKDFNATTSSIASRLTSNISTFQRSTKALPDSERCEPLRSRLCTYMGYNQTRLPNLAGHRNQLQAERQISSFLPFIRANCSRALKDFVCATYLPPCSSPQLRTIPPCRKLCLKTKSECASLMRAFEFDWPEHLDCHELPSKQKGGCVVAYDRRTLALPTQATQFQRVSGMTEFPTTTILYPFISTKKSQIPSWRKKCGGILSRPSGIITTPNFPKPYSPDTVCKWAIILPKVYHVIDIILEEAALEADVNCGYDYLLFLDGLSNQVGPRVCGFLAYPRVITVKGNMAFIVFRSDSALNKKGFLIKYRAHSYP